MTLQKEAKKAILIGGMCAISYLAVYFATNVLAPSVPGMLSSGDFEVSTTTRLASIYFVVYAIGQLINGYLGNFIPAKHMISFGLVMAGLCHGAFSLAGGALPFSYFFYGASGFFLSMIYGPMTRVVAENTVSPYTARCSLGYTFSSFLGTPLAGIVVGFFVWKIAFGTSAFFLIAMGTACFLVFTLFEKKGIVSSLKITPKENGKKSGISVLIRREIIQFTFISILTGTVRTAVMYWFSTYAHSALGFSEKNSSLIYSAASILLSFCTFAAVFLYEKLDYNMKKAILIFFSLAALFFFLMLAIKNPICNIALLSLAIFSANGAASMMWSQYCPGLRDTGMVSGATGYLDFLSYMAAASSTALFGGAVEKIGWQNLIFVWGSLMVLGILTSLFLKGKQDEKTV